MKITEALKSLENSWSRDEVLLKIRNGEDSEKIINDFCFSKTQEIETLNNFINQGDKVLLSEIEDLSNIESKLINKIKNYKLDKDLLSKYKEDKKQISKSERNTAFDLGVFMMKWSNKFVFISLLAISAIALTKQAWA